MNCDGMTSFMSVVFGSIQYYLGHRCQISHRCQIPQFDEVAHF